MTEPSGANFAASILQRLRNYTRTTNGEHNHTLQRFVNERALYRLSRSTYNDLFILKGAMVLELWLGGFRRPTRDIDLLGSVSNDLDEAVLVFREILGLVVEPDGVEFDIESVTARSILDEHSYHGVRVNAKAQLGSARLNVQIDFGVDDVLRSRRPPMVFPTLLDLPAPLIRGYPREALVAEKFEAMVSLGMSNSRLKDFFDLWYLAGVMEFEDAALVAAIQATFARRNTPVPSALPLALSRDFAEDPSKRSQWAGFLSRSGVAAPSDLAEVVTRVAEFLMPVIAAEVGLPMRWSPESRVWLASP